MENKEWISTSFDLPVDGKLKLLSIRKGNELFHGTGRFKENGWIDQFDNPFPEGLRVTGWMDIEASIFMG